MSCQPHPPPSDSALWHISARHQHTYTKTATPRCDTNSGLCTSGLDDPLPLSQTVRAQLLGDVSRRHCIEQVLLIGRKTSATTSRISSSINMLLSSSSASSILSLFITTANDVDQTTYSPAVLVPQMLDLALVFRAPHGETWILVLHCLNVETDGRDCGHPLHPIFTNNSVVFPTASSPPNNIIVLVSPAKFSPYSFSPSPHGCGSAPELHLPAHSSPAPLPCHQTSQYPVTVHGQSSASTARELDTDLPLLLPPLPTAAASAAAALSPSADFLGALLSPNCRCTGVSPHDVRNHRGFILPAISSVFRHSPCCPDSCS